MAQVIIFLGRSRGGIGAGSIWIMAITCWAITIGGKYLAEHGQPGAINMSLGAIFVAIPLTFLAVWATIQDIAYKRRQEGNR